MPKLVNCNPNYRKHKASGQAVVTIAGRDIYLGPDDFAGLAACIPIITAAPDGNAMFNLRALYRKRLRIIGIDSLSLTTSACAGLLNAMLPLFSSAGFKTADFRAASRVGCRGI